MSGKLTLKEKFFNMSEGEILEYLKQANILDASISEDSNERAFVFLVKDESVYPSEFVLEFKFDKFKTGDLYWVLIRTIPVGLDGVELFDYVMSGKNAWIDLGVFGKTKLRLEKELSEIVSKFA
jgi:hypothetical protein